MTLTAVDVKSCVSVPWNTVNAVRMAEFIIYHSSLGRGPSCNSTRVGKMVIKTYLTPCVGENSLRQVVVSGVNVKVTGQGREKS